MIPTTFDPTAGERARAVAEWGESLPALTDPTAGRRALAIRDGIGRAPIVDPTDPRHVLRRPERESSLR